ncbi:MAG: DNA helicase II [Proteobacteria bacterium]|nr:DNA helicase II [Pseudomonadota bacterium]NCA28449.1 DNA helicase II [Pseudomonadota bacterium]
MLDSLNQPQAHAVSTTEGPLLVLAGAGTGKTKVLTSRIIYILQNGLAMPSEILAVTFTNKASAEMKKRIAEFIDHEVNHLWVGTFHSICAKILRRHPEVVGLKSDFTIIDDDDQNRLLKQILSDLNIDHKQFPPKNYLAKISRLKDSGKISINFDDVNLPKLKEVFETYQQRLKTMNSVDFGDLLTLNLEIFNSAPEILQIYQNKFRYILVDEYQDTNDAQYQWLIKLSQLYQNICCVGDDDQSIYSWRGANVANILRFEKDFKDAQIIRLEQNYRSTSRILRTAHAVIANNKERHGKTLWSELGEGEKVQLYSFYDDRTEASKVAQHAKNNIAQGFTNPSKIAILVRAGYQTRQFEEAFMQNGLPYRVIGGMKFYERLEIRDAIAYLRLCSNFSDDLALLRIINVPKRGVGDAGLSSLRSLARERKVSIFEAIKFSLSEGTIKGKSKENLTNFVNQIEKYHDLISTKSLNHLCKDLLEEAGYMESWRLENTIESQGRIENLEEFIKSLSDFANIIEFLEYATLVEARDDKNSQDAINIMTIHASKGLEFDLVFLPGLEEGIFPSSKSVEQKNGLEEERRLMYVGITRAKKKLIMSFVKTRYLYGDVQNSLPSRFLKELPENEINFEEVGYGFNKSYQGFDNQKQDFFDDEFDDKNQFLGSKSNHSKGRFELNFSQIAQRKFINNLGAIKSNFSSIKTEEKTSLPIKSSHNNSPLGNASLLNARVFHQKFGYGKIVDVDGNRLTINFEKTGVKTVIKDFVSFE